MAESFDTLIVGGGTAGCVLANRLSADPSHRVALLEAGVDYGPHDNGKWPTVAAQVGHGIGHHDWEYTTILPAGEVPYFRGKIIGGSSAVNAGGVNIGLRRDYDRWEALGNTGWGFSDLLPFFQMVERLQNDDVPMRGTGGMLPVERMRATSPYLHALTEAIVASGIPRVSDVTGPDALTGVGSTTRNVIGQTRFHSAAAYLDPARHRPNLTIFPNATANRLVWDNGKVTGVLVTSSQGQKTFTANRVILTAGAVGSPAILQRSGIGDRDILRTFHPDQPVHHLPGVGRNLHDHYGTTVVVQASDCAYDTIFPEPPEDGLSVRFAVSTRFKSDDTRDDFDHDVFSTHLAHHPDSPTDAAFTFRIFLVQPESEGSVVISSLDPEVPPHIDVDFGSDWDIERISRTVEWLRSLYPHSELAPFLSHEIKPGAVIAGADLRKWVRHHLDFFHHPTGTCKMGPTTDPFAVVDATGKVYGFENLYVADASIMPTIPHGMPILTVYAAAEKIAAGLTLR